MGILQRLRKAGGPAVLGSAAQRKLKDRVTSPLLESLHQPWQDRAWDFYYEIGEINFAMEFKARAIAKVSLIPGELDDQGVIQPTENDAVQTVLDDLSDGVSGHANMLYQASRHLGLVGETNLVGYTDSEPMSEGEETEFPGFLDHPIAVAPGEVNKWEILSNQELKRDQASGGYRRVRIPGETGQPLPTGTFALRIWNPDPRYKMLATSRIRGVMNRCEELLVLSDAVMAEARSRMGAGILKVPTELELPPSDDVPEGAEPFTHELITAMTTPIRDPRSASAVVPLVVRGPSEHLSGLDRVDLARRPTKDEGDRREEVIKRIAHGLDLPPEVLFGLGDLTHWNAWLVSEDLFRHGIEPDLRTFVNDLTYGLLRPALGMLGVSEAEAQRLFIWYDATDLVEKPDRSGEAKEAHDRGLIGDRTYREATGWSEDDAPSPMNPHTSMPNAPMIDDGDGTQPSTRVDQDQPPEPMMAAGNREDIGQKLASIDRALMERLAVSADATITRALEKAGARLRGKVNRIPELKALLQGVPYSHTAATLGRAKLKELGIDEDELITEYLEGYSERATRWMTDAQRQALRKAALAAGLSPDEIEELYGLQMEANRQEAIGILTAGLLAVALKALYDPSGKPPTKGEFDDLKAPRSEIRQALAVAGGLSNSDTPDGIGNGEVVREILRQGGLQVQGYRWNYGTAPRAEFPPHVALDGVEFESMDDSILEVNAEDDWLGVSHYAPGDHAFCLCSAEQIVIEALAAAGKPVAIGNGASKIARMARKVGQ